ncbi:MAG: recombinase family protein [Treponema sp.]|nr:recombinase family protein [Treponema sp.]
MNRATIKNAVGIYVRLSDEDRDKKHTSKIESESIQNQKSMLLQYCKERSWNVCDVYCDENYSGADRSRPDFNRLLEDCEKGRINIVICKTQSRFSRDMEIIERYIHDKFPEWGVRFVSVIDHADTELEGNKKARQINGLINEWYLEDLSLNIRRTLKHKKEKGEHCSGFAPYGYMKDPNNKSRLIPDPVAAEVVKDIFRMHNAGYGYQKIARTLNERGVLTPTLYKKSQGINFSNGKQKEIDRTRHGSIWKTPSIFHMVRNEVYTGALVQGKSTCVSYKNRRKIIKPKDEWIIIPNSHEPIIDDVTWEITQKRLENQTRPQFDTAIKHVFAGKIFCGYCSGTMKKSGSQSHKYFHCRTVWNKPGVCHNKKYLPVVKVEDFVLGEINQLLSNNFDENLIDIACGERKKRLFALEEERKSIDELLSKKEAAIEMLYMDRVEGVVSKERYALMLSKLESDIRDFQKRLIGIEKEVLGESKKSAKKSLLLDKYKKIEILTHEIVDEFIDKIEVLHFDKMSGERKINVYLAL